jgi:hypothetical protein
MFAREDCAMAEPALKLESDPEGREAPRRRVLLGATLVFGPDMLTVRCSVRDLSQVGAKIQVPDALALPSTVWLVNHTIPAAHECKIVWRRGNLIGLQFIRHLGLDPLKDERLKPLRRIWLENAPRSSADLY